MTSLEFKHVTHVYDHIAKHFSDTRHKAWPRVCQFLQSLDSGSLVYDIGCGNGKYAGINPLIHLIGADTSIELLKIAHMRAGVTDVMLSDVKTLPFRSGSADNVISIAVLHHLSTHSGRLKAVEEISRVLKISGTALLTVWAFEQNRNGSASKYITKSSKADPVLALDDEDAAANATQQLSSASSASSSTPPAPQSSERVPDLSKSSAVPRSSSGRRDDDHGVAGGLPIHRNRTPFQSQDVLVPWTDKSTGETLLRYYHVFVEDELTLLCNKIPGIAVIDHYYDEGNWCVVIQKQEQEANT